MAGRSMSEVARDLFGDLRPAVAQHVSPARKRALLQERVVDAARAYHYALRDVQELGDEQEQLLRTHDPHDPDGLRAELEWLTTKRAGAEQRLADAEERISITVTELDR